MPLSSSALSIVQGFKIENLTQCIEIKLYFCPQAERWEITTSEFENNSV
jgi:IS30 family transposase